MGRVLLVDDEPGLLFALSEVLEARGHTVVTASGGPDGLALLDGIETVVTDFTMPGMSGLEVLDGVLLWDPELPVVLLSAVSSRLVAAEALRRGAYAWVGKPFDNAEVCAVVERALAARAAWRGLGRVGPGGG